MRGTYVDVEGALRRYMRQIFLETAGQKRVLTDGVARILVFLS
jgi:hypothetical protein